MLIYSFKVQSNVTFLQIHIQYWSIDGKYRIYLTRLRNGVKDELLASLSPRLRFRAESNKLYIYHQ